MVLNEEKGKQGNKEEKLTESLHWTVKIAKWSNYNCCIDLIRLRRGQQRGVHDPVSRTNFDKFHVSREL